jgi:hypothetical protein
MRCGGLIKLRVGLAGRGKRGGARVLLATNRIDRWFFVFGFEKNERESVSDDELAGISADLLSLISVQLDDAVSKGILLEILDDDKTQTPEPRAGRRP